MSDLKAKLTGRIQSGFPITPSPFAELAREFDVTEDVILTVLSEIKADGIIRRIGASIDSRKAGYISTLVGCKVEPDYLEAVALEIGHDSRVTHAYERADEINFWFTLICRNEKMLDETLGRYSRLPGMINLQSMPAEKVYKIKVRFDTGDD